MGNLSTNFGVSGTFRSRFMGQHLSDAPRAITTLTFQVIPLVDDTGLRSPSVTLCTKFEVCRRSYLEDMTHLLSQLSLVTLALKVVHITRTVGNLPTILDVSETFRSQLVGQYLSDAPRDITTFTFDVGGHGSCRLYGSSYYICVPSLKIVGPSVLKMTH